MPASGLSSRLKICPDCGEVYPDSSTECYAHHTALLDWNEASDELASTEVREPPPGMESGPLDVGDLTEPEVELPPALALEPRVPSELAQPARAARRLGGRYRLGRRLGFGGYGAVFAAHDERLDKRVAIKLLSPAVTQDPNVGRRFKREALAASRVQHECVVDVTDFDIDGAGTSFFVMEYLDGLDLSEVLEDDGPLDIARALAIAAQCASALTATHAEGILHRDLKPANIFVVSSASRADFVKIIDFGISKVTNAGSDYSDLTSASRVVGTPYYMPPEQARGKTLDGRTDVYALGVILFEMLTDRRPFVGASALEILTNAATQRRVAPSTLRPEIAAVPGLDELVLRAIAVKRSKRYESMQAFGEAIIACLATIDPALAQTLPSMTGEARPESPGANDVVPEKPAGGVLAIGAGPATIETSSGEVTRAYRAVARRSWLRAGLLAAAVAVALVVLWVRTSGGDSAEERSAAGETPARRAPMTAAPNEVDAATAVTAPSDPRAAIEDAAVPAAVTVRLTSTPAGAAVAGQNRGRLGETPLDVTLAAGEDSVELHVSLPGHADETLWVDRDSGSELHVALEPARAPADVETASRPRRKRARPAKSTQSKPEQNPDKPDKPDNTGIGIKDW